MEWSRIDKVLRIKGRRGRKKEIENNERWEGEREEESTAIRIIMAIVMVLIMKHIYIYSIYPDWRQ